MVRNTFIDIDEPRPYAPDLRRSKSEPAKGQKSDDYEGSDSDDDGGPEQTESHGGEGDPDADPAPEPTTLIRMETRDSYETAEMWSWAQQSQYGGSQQQQVYQQQSTMIPMQTAAVPMMMVPVGTGVALPGPAAGFEPPVVQQPLRCVRKPEDQPNLAASSSGAAAVATERRPPTDASQSSPSPQPQTLTRVFSVSRNAFRINWTVDARKLRGNDKQAVSPPFELSFGPGHPSVTFKMMIYPKVSSENKGGASFKKAKGKGSIQLKCEAELEEASGNVTFQISIGSGAVVQGPRGPVQHNFASSPACGLPPKQEEWDFNEVVEQESMTFVVCLEVLAQGF